MIRTTTTAAVKANRLTKAASKNGLPNGAVPVGYRAIGVHDRESRDLGRANLSIRTSLARVGAASKIVSLHSHPPGALCAKGKYA